MSAQEYMEHCVDGEIAKRLPVMRAHRSQIESYRALRQKAAEADVGMGPPLTSAEFCQLHGAANFLALEFIDLVGP